MPYAVDPHYYKEKKKKKTPTKSRKSTGFTTALPEHYYSYRNYKSAKTETKKTTTTKKETPKKTTTKKTTTKRTTTPVPKKKPSQSRKTPTPKRKPSSSSSKSSEKPVKIVKTKGGDYNVYKKSSKKAQSFRSAFANARKAGKKTFTWNGKKYTTKVK